MCVCFFFTEKTVFSDKENYYRARDISYASRRRDALIIIYAGDKRREREPVHLIVLSPDPYSRRRPFLRIIIERGIIFALAHRNFLFVQIHSDYHHHPSTQYTCSRRHAPFIFLYVYRRRSCRALTFTDV